MHRTARSGGLRAGWPRLVSGHAQPLERPPNQAGDVHLGDANALRDFALREVLPEAQMEDEALPLRQFVERRPDRHAVLDELEPLVRLPKGVGDGLALVVARAQWGV